MEFLTRKVAGKVPVWALLVAAVAIGLYLRWRSSRTQTNPAAQTNDTGSSPDLPFGDTSGGVQFPNGGAPGVTINIETPQVVTTPATGDASSPAPAPAQTPPAGPPPQPGGSMPDIPPAQHDAPTGAPPTYTTPPDTPPGYTYIPAAPTDPHGGYVPPGGGGHFVND